MSFSARFCRQHALPPEAFEATVLQRSLYPTARRLYPVLRLFPGYFAPDLNLIRHVGHLRRIEDFRSEEIDFAQDPANHRLLRGSLRLRVSTRRLQRLVRAAFDSAPALLPR